MAQDRKKKKQEHIFELIRKGHKGDPVVTERELLEALKKLKVKPSEAYRIVNDKINRDNSENIRFNWKMLRFTLFIWQRVKEHEDGYLKPKIDTVRDVIKDVRMEQFFYGYFPDIKMNAESEGRALNKLIAEKSQQQYLMEGYYLYERTKKIIPQKHLNTILLSKI